MAATHHTERLVDGLRRQLRHVTDEQIRDLVAAWATAWDEVAPDLRDALTELTRAAEDGQVTRSMLLRSSRLKNALAAIADRLDTLAKQAGVRITGDLDDVVRQAGEAQAHIIATQLPPQVTAGGLTGWDRVSPDAIDAIVRRTTKRITSSTRPLGRDASRVMRRELIRGITAGSNPRATAARMLARAEGRFNGGLTRAVAIARTETLDAHREASRLSRIANSDVLAGWRWHCELTTRSCPACIAMDGTLFPADAPGPDDHVNGRCVAVPEPKPWSELGFDIPEPASVLVPARDRFADMAAAEQRTILGPSRFEAWQSGRYPVDNWAVTKSNSGWRDSVQVSKAPSGGRGSSRLAS